MKEHDETSGAAKRKSRERFTFFATCAPGLEPVLHEEARELQFGLVERQVGGVRFAGTIEDAWRANLWFSSAIRVLLRLERFEAVDGDELYRGVQKIDWSRWLVPDATFVIDAQTKESKLDHSQFVAHRVKDAIVDQFRAASGRRPSVDKDAPELVVNVHISRDRATISVDTSGESLHKRGWRREQGRAPLAETTAAAIVRLSGWDRRSPFVDPFAGSGTIVIEAALWAAKRAPGSFRERFGFEFFPSHDAAAWRTLRDEVRASFELPKKLSLVAIESDPRAIDSLHANLESAGLAGRVAVERGRAETYDYKRGWNAWIVTNPPYGERVGDERELATLYRKLGERWRELCGGWHVSVLSGNPRLARELGLDGATSLALKNGALECELLRAELPRVGI